MRLGRVLQSTGSHRVALALRFTSMSTMREQTTPRKNVNCIMATWSAVLNSCYAAYMLADISTVWTM